MGSCIFVIVVVIIDGIIGPSITKQQTTAIIPPIVNFQLLTNAIKIFIAIPIMEMITTI
jgi:hypothetical protein